MQWKMTRSEDTITPAWGGSASFGLGGTVQKYIRKGKGKTTSLYFGGIGLGVSIGGLPGITFSRSTFWSMQGKLITSPSYHYRHLGGPGGIYNLGFAAGLIAGKPLEQSGTSLQLLVFGCPQCTFLPPFGLQVVLQIIADIKLLGKKGIPTIEGYALVANTQAGADAGSATAFSGGWLTW